MMYQQFNKLQSLFERIEIINPDREIMTSDELQIIEESLGKKLPDDYKHFCQKLGTGRASILIDLYCPTEANVNNSHEATREMLEAIDRALLLRNKNNRYVERGDREYIEVQNEYHSLLQNALIFASFNDDRVIFWNLNSYSIEDDCYDIYWLDLYSPDATRPIHIGKSFTDFLCDFCYGQLACSLIPEFCPDGQPIDVEYVFG
jgi:hypothetical protein